MLHWPLDFHLIQHSPFNFYSWVTRLYGVCFLSRVWMCWCPEMESYEEFCLQSLAILQERGEFKKKTWEPLCSLKAHSVICFHGRAVLSPLVRETIGSSYKYIFTLMERLCIFASMWFSDFFWGGVKKRTASSRESSILLAGMQFCYSQSNKDTCFLLFPC